MYEWLENADIKASDIAVPVPDYTANMPKFTQELLRDVVDEVIVAANKIKIVLENEEIPDNINPDLKELLGEGKILSHVLAHADKKIIFRPSAIRRMDTGQVFIVECIHTGKKDYSRGKEYWWFSRQLRSGVCRKCGGELNASPVVYRCRFCGCHLPQQPWMLIRVVDGVEQIGGGMPAPSIRSYTISKQQWQQFNQRVDRVMRLILEELFTGRRNLLDNYFDGLALKSVHNLLDSPEMQTWVKTQFRKAKATDRLFLHHSADFESDGSIETGIYMGILLNTLPEQNPVFDRLIQWEFLWERSVPRECPDCGISVPQVDSIDVCPACGNSRGIGEWRVYQVSELSK